MWGFLLGAACLYGLVRTMRGGGWAYAHGYGHGPWGRRRWGGWRHEGWEGSGHAGGRGPLRWLFQRMDTSPGQEKVIAEAAAALRGTMRGWHDDAERMRSDVARSIRGETFDPTALEEASPGPRRAWPRSGRRCAGRRRESTRRSIPGSEPSWQISCPPAGAGGGEEKRPCDVTCASCSSPPGSFSASARASTRSGCGTGSAASRGSGTSPASARTPRVGHRAGRLRPSCRQARENVRVGDRHVRPGAVHR